MKTSAPGPWVDAGKGSCDFGGHRGSGDYEVASPDTLEELQAVVVRAGQRGQALRLRGNAHSMHGLSVPRSGELQVQMSGCRQYRLESDGTLVVGAGASVWDVHQMLRQYGWGLKVSNDGGAAAATVGGFMAAGGFGRGSEGHGGFWNTVRAVTLVSGAGEICRWGRGDLEFPWLFGSLGQLGVAYELTIETERLRGEGFQEMGVGGAGRIDGSRPTWEPMRWHTLLVPRADGPLARRQLIGIGARHREAWRGRWPYTYVLPFRHFNPLLIHPHQGDLLAVGIWGGRPSGGFHGPAFDAMEWEIGQLVEAHPHYRRYVQSEYLPVDFDFGRYFGDRIFGMFRELKRRLDPQGLLVPGVVPGRGIS